MAGRWKIVIMLMVLAALGHFNRIGISVAGSEVFIPKMGISEPGMGWVYTGFLILYTLGMMPAGWLIDRIGAIRALALYALFMGCFVMLTGVLGWFVDSPAGLWIGLMVIRGLAGICNAPLHPGAARVVSDVMPGPRQATANSMVTAGALVGIAFCFPLYGKLIDNLSWQLAFVVGGALLAGYSLVWTLLAKPPTEPATRHNADSKHDSKPPAEPTITEHKPSLAMLMRLPSLWLITLSYAAYGYFQYLFFYWMDYYFKKVLEVPAESSRMASFCIMLSMGLGMYIGGVGTDRFCKWLGTMNGRRAIVMLGMGLGAVFGVVGVGLGSLGMGLAVIATCLAVSMAATGMVEGAFWTSATDIGGKSGGQAGAFMNTGGNLGGLISPVLTPIMAQTIGWTGSIVVACVISLVGGLVWFAIEIPRPAVTEIDELSPEN